MIFSLFWEAKVESIQLLPSLIEISILYFKTRCTSLRAQCDSSNCEHVVLLSVSEFSWTSQNLIHCIKKSVKEDEEGLMHILFSSVRNWVLIEKYVEQNEGAVRMFSKRCFK